MNAPEKQFELAVRAYSDALYRYAFWLCKNAADAEDLVQDCYQRAWRNWSQLKDEKAVKQWLFVILRREFFRRSGQQTVQFVGEEALQALPDFQAGPDEVYALRQALSRAPLSLRDPLLLQVLGGFNCEEIAQLENTSSGAIMTRLTRARQWFRNYSKAEVENKEVRK